MNNRTLGTLALLGAPFRLIGMVAEEHVKSLANSWFTGVWGLFYITAWQGSMVALQRVQITGRSRFGKTLLWVITGTLLLANVSNVYQLLAPGQRTVLFVALDAFWPLSNLVMLVVGVAAAKVGRLRGWQRYVPLAAGCWFPFAMLTLTLLGRTPLALWIGGTYSALTWTLLALVAMKPNVRPVESAQLAKPAFAN